MRGDVDSRDCGDSAPGWAVMKGATWLPNKLHCRRLESTACRALLFSSESETLSNLPRSCSFRKIPSKVAAVK